MLCKICHQNKKLIKCHILPEAIHKDTYDGMAIEVSAEKHAKKLQIGHYDGNLACKDCEDKFHPYDEYFIDFFRNHYLKNYEKVRDKNGQIIAHKYTNMRCGLLYGFFVYHLLRASLSNLEYYQEVTLGEKYNNLLISSLLNDTLPRNTSGIELIFSTYGKKSRIHEPPHRNKKYLNKINIYNFTLLGGMEICYKVDSKSWPKYRICILRANSNELFTPIILMRSYHKKLHNSNTSE